MRNDGQLQVQDYRTATRVGASWVPAVVIGFILLVILGVLGVRWRYYFGTQHEAVRREVYEESQAHVRGVNVDIARLRVEWEKGSPAMRRALELEAQTRVAYIDDDKLLPQNAAWLRQIGVL